MFRIQSFVSKLQVSIDFLKYVFDTVDLWTPYKRRKNLLFFGNETPDFL